MQHLFEQSLQIGAGSYFHRWVQHEPGSAFWERINLANRIADLKVPGCYIGGWYDVFGPATLAVFAAFRRGAGSEMARKRSQLNAGPWTHGMSTRGDANFGSAASFNVEQYQNEWFD
jgi:predicted acyl esterase